jgi:REP element-mobilizing transposase RayT
MNAVEKNLTMQDPLAYFITWPTYGSWLPGDQRGLIEYQKGWQMPNVSLHSVSKARMNETQCLLSQRAREIVETQVAETCRFRNWVLHAVACQSNHMHMVVEAFETTPQKVRSDMKAWCTRRLKQEIDSTREKWWAERGSVRYIWDQESLDRVLLYVLESQQLKHLDH